MKKLLLVVAACGFLVQLIGCGGGANEKVSLGDAEQSELQSFAPIEIDATQTIAATSPPPPDSEQNVAETATPTPTQEAAKSPIENTISVISEKYNGDARLMSGRVYEWMGKLKVEMYFSQVVGLDGFAGIVAEVTDDVWKACEDNDILCIDINLTVWVDDKHQIDWRSSLDLDANDNDHLFVGTVTDERNGFEMFSDVSAYAAGDVLCSDEEIQAQKDAEAAIPIESKDALNKGEQYLNVMPFSYSGLIKQLEYEGYSTEAATYAADNCGADWNEEAAEKAADYLDVMSFSRDRLISQLEFDGFTHDQAVYGAEQNGY